jgi:hypothetical protein
MTHTLKFYWEHKKGKFILGALIAFLITANTLGTAAFLMTKFSVESTNLVKEVWANLDNTTYERTVVVEVEKEDTAVIMERIAKCESEGKHFLSNGRINKHINVDKKTGKPTGSIDYGKWMINDAYHEADARKLGYDIYTPEGNEQMAYHLYHTQGTEPWIWTKSCWVKK